MRILIFGLGTCLAGMLGTVAMAATSSPVTFNKEVLPVLQKNCQTCHRPGEITPMSLLTYKDARPWAKAIKSAVVNRKMPPWFADPKVGHFANDMTMSDADINTQVSWVDNGALEGNPKDAPAPLKFVDGWNVRPDLVVTMPKPFVVPAKGTVNYKFFLVKTNFPEDMWVTAAEMRTGNSKVLHHGDPRSSSHRRSSHQPDRRTAALEAVPGCFGEGRGCMTLKITSIEIVSTIGESWTRFKMREGVRG